MPSGKSIDWSKYDYVLRSFLPNLTIKEFGKRYMPGMCVRAIGVRARKLDIKPLRYSPTEEHRKAVSSYKSKQATQEQIEYIKAKANKISRVRIASDLGISFYLVDKIAKENGIIFDKQKSAKFQADASRKHINRATAASSAKWNDDVFRKSQSELISERNKKLWQSERFRLKIRAGIRKTYNDTDLRLRLSEIGKARYIQDESVRSILHSDRQFKNSKLNDDVAVVLSGYGIEYEREFRLSNYAFDFKIDNILLEVNGDYWHKLPNNERNDQAKATTVEKFFPEFSLRRIWESEFRSIHGKERLLEILGIEKPNPVQVKLNELDFTNIDKKAANRFLGSYHYLGPSNRAKYIWAMTLYGEPIVIALFGQPVRQNTAPGKTIELVRLCRHPRFFNKNLMTFFLSKCLKELHNTDYNWVIAFADDRLHTGSVYKASNWIYHGITASDYEYRSADNIPMHKKTLYNRARASGMTERAYAEANGFVKTSNGSRHKFVYKLH